MNRDLDADIAEQVFGWTLHHVGKDYDGLNECDILAPESGFPEGLTFPPKGVLHRGWYTPQWSGDLNTAIELCQQVNLPVSITDLPKEPEKIAQMCLDHFKKSK